MSRRAYTVGTTKADCWNEVLHRCGSYDVYHLPEYHRLAEEQEDAQAVLFVCETQSRVVAMPILLRRIGGLPGIGPSEARDVTSVYGYPGPISNLQYPSKEVVRHFAVSLCDYFKSKRVVTAFSRLHPLFPSQASYLRDLDGQVLEIGPTVAIDLSLPIDVQHQQYRNNHKRDINKAKRKGVTCVHDEGWSYLNAFIDVYCETMCRVDADHYYFFDRTYFTRLRELLGDHLHLFVALKEGVVISGALFTVCNSTIQYHLGGTDARYLNLAPSKLIFDTVRLWGTEIGARIFHLGGGVGSREDNLFHFKAGFSKLRYQFKIWRMIVDQDTYDQLTEQKRIWNEASGLEATDNNYFPAYRCPTRKVSHTG